MMTNEEVQALKERFARELAEWDVKRAELQEEAERNGQYFDYKITTKSVGAEGEEPIVYEQKITYTIKPLSKRALKAKADTAAMEARIGKNKSKPKA